MLSPSQHRNFTTQRTPSSSPVTAATPCPLLRRLNLLARPSGFWGLFGILVVAIGGCAHHTNSTVAQTYGGAGEDAVLVDEQLTCITSGTQVGNAWYSNINGHQEQTIDVAKSPEGRDFPVGTLVQLLIGEAMVKRGEGFSPDTGDWEFFRYKVEGGKSVILDRGTTEVRNPLGTCASCHTSASKHDFVCATGRGCKPLPKPVVKMALRKAHKDSRCGN